MKQNYNYRYISYISLEEFERDIVIPCSDDEGFSALLIKNSNPNKKISSVYKTNNLKWELNKILQKEGQPFSFHIIKMLSKDLYSVSQFNIIFEYIFSKIQSPISDLEMQKLFNSLEDLFRVTPEKDLRKLQTGVYGELLTLRYLYENGVDEIGNKYHNHFSSKHDIEINSDVRIEVKSSVGEKRIHRFSHNQISRTDITVLIASLIFEESKEGTPLKELFNYAFNIISDPDIIFNLHILYKRCGLEESDGVKFSLMKAFDDIRFINASDAPKIPVQDFDGISNISYDVDLSMAKYYALDDLLNFLKEDVTK